MHVETCVIVTVVEMVSDTTVTVHWNGTRSTRRNIRCSTWEVGYTVHFPPYLNWENKITPIIEL